MGNIKMIIVLLVHLSSPASFHSSAARAALRWRTRASAGDSPGLTATAPAAAAPPDPPPAEEAAPLSCCFSADLRIRNEMNYY